MKIEYINPSKLKDYKNNPRYNDDAIDYVANSIEEFGFKVPILVDSDNEIVAGHTRKQASMELGLDKVPVIRIDDLSDEQIKAFRLADNKVAEFSEWDNDLLEIELNDIGKDIELAEFGFEPLAVDDDNNGSNMSEYNPEDDDGGEAYEGETKPRGYNITYEIAFNNEDEQKRWYEILGTLRKEYPDADTIAERILLAMEAWQSGR